MPDFPLLGAFASFSKTVTEADVGLFAGVTGDFAPQHVDAAFMASHPMGQRVAHGVLSLGVSSTAASALCARQAVVAVSYGYDKLRFLAPVFLGDTLRAEYRVVDVDSTKRVATCQVRVTNQNGALVLVARHLLYCYEGEDA